MGICHRYSVQCPRACKSASYSKHCTFEFPWAYLHTIPCTLHRPRSLAFLAFLGRSIQANWRAPKIRFKKQGRVIQAPLQSD